MTGNICTPNKFHVVVGDLQICKRTKNIEKLIYSKSSIRSRPCIISNPKFPRLVLEVFQKLQFLEQNFLSEAAHKGPNRVILKDLNFGQ